MCQEGSCQLYSCVHSSATKLNFLLGFAGAVELDHSASPFSIRLLEVDKSGHIRPFMMSSVQETKLKHTNYFQVSVCSYFVTTFPEVHHNQSHD